MTTLVQQNTLTQSGVAEARSNPAASEREPPSIGSSVKHYEIIRKLGQGGMGVVFLARDTKLGRLVALKILIEHRGRGDGRFLAEARATARCKHENIVDIYEIDELRGTPYMVLEYLDGRTLRAWMEQREDAGAPLPPGVAVELVIPVVRALACAHPLGIVHRDLKPENIFLTTAGRVVVLDFGVATHAGAPEMRATTGAATTIPEGIVGTLAYMSPEQWRAEGVDLRSDIWAVGILLYELLTGEHPLAPLSTFALAKVMDLARPMPSVSEKRLDLGALGAVVDRCLKKRREERFETAEDLLLALTPFVPDARAQALGEGECPFTGLSAFQEADAARFFGREREVAELIGRLRTHPLVAVAGPSGAGKSSFVRAGVIPALKRSAERWETFILRPGRGPLAALAEVLAQVSGLGDAAAFAAALRIEPGLLGAEMRARCRRSGGRHRLLLFVDQFEELYTQGIDPDERAAFVACLAGAADDAASPLRVMLSIRADFLDRLAEDRRLMIEVTRGLSFLPPMGPAELREALTRPALAAGYRFESEAMIDGMLGALEQTRSPLPLLQFTASKLWEARDRARLLLTEASYEEIGGVAGALSTHADAILAGLSPLEHRLCRAVFLRLVTSERTRAVVSLAELRGLGEGDEVGPLIAHLADARLLLIEASEGREGATVEICHESLIERWPRLKQWLEESALSAEFLGRLRSAAQQWEGSSEAEGLLWRDRAAEDARVWLERLRADQGEGAPLGIGKREERYLRAVVAFSERSRRRRRQLAAAVITALVGIAALVSLFAARASREAAHAQAEARQARNATRVAAARELQNDPTTALVLLREVEPPGVPRGWGDLSLGALHSGLALWVLPHPDEVQSGAWSPDGQRLVTAGVDRTARVWSADGTGEPLILRGHEGVVRTAAWSPDGKHIVTSSDDGTARVWSADGTGEPLILRGHEGTVYTAVFRPDGQRIVTAGADKTARVWNTDGTGEPLILHGHEGQVFAAAFSPDGGRVVTASYDGTARVWSADGKGAPLVFRYGEGAAALSAAWSPDGQRVVVACEDRIARVWSADGTGEPLLLRGHEGRLFSAVWSPDGRRIVTASEDATARVWSADGVGEPRVLRGHQGPLTSAAWSPDGQRILTTSRDRTARAWNVFRIGEPLVFRGSEKGCASAMFSPDGKRIVTGCYDKTARVWSADGTGEPLVLRGHEGLVIRAAFDPDGKRIVTASVDTTARVWSADGTGEPIVLRGHQERLASVAWSPDGKRVVTASRDRTARVWSADGTGDPVVLRGHESGVTSAAFDPESKRVVTASLDKTARVWSVDGAGEPLILRGHEGTVTWAAFSPDGQRIVTASYDKTARVWSADGRGEPLVLRGHEAALMVAAWSPDGQRIVTASWDKTVRVWSADGTGEPLVLRGHEGMVTSAAWSSDGERVVSAGDDKTIRVWSDLTALRATTDPRLWTATAYCPSVARRIELLSSSEAAARADQEACQRGVQAARRGP